MLVFPRQMPPEPAHFFPTAMGTRPPHEPAIYRLQEPEPKFVEFTNHRFSVSFCVLCVLLRLNHDAQRVRYLGGQFHIVAQIRFRLRAVALPQFREGFAIAVLRTHPQMFGN